MEDEILYILNFEDGTKYEGGNRYSPNWNLAPDKPIKSMDILQFTGDYLTLYGYEKYNFFIEAVASVGGKDDVKLTYIFALGKKGKQITSFRISLTDYHEHKENDITVRLLESETEYYGRPTFGWHEGKT